MGELLIRTPRKLVISATKYGRTPPIRPLVIRIGLVLGQIEPELYKTNFPLSYRFKNFKSGVVETFRRS
jgi:hypothetical protein